MPGVHLQLLGRFQVRRDGEEVPPAAFGGRKVRTLLRVLAVRRPDLVPRDVLAEALWPDRLPADPAGNLGVLVNRARRALGDPALIVTGGGGYALGACSCDLAEFADALGRAREAGDDHRAALRAYTAALALWGEPLAEDTYAEWAREPRGRLLRDRTDAGEGAARAALALGDARSAVEHATTAVAADPLRESAALLLARALAAGGDTAAALARLAELRERLADRLGVDPSAECAELELTLLRGGRGSRTRPVRAPAPTRPPAFGGLVFVGRDGEMARLRDAVAGRAVVMLGGDPGFGKSRLLAELSGDSALPVVAARAVLPEREEAWALARSLLREAMEVDDEVAGALPVHVRSALAGVVPEWADGPVPPLEGETRRALLLAGGLRVLEAVTGDGALLVVDDLQWADPSSLVLLGSVLARIPNLAVVLAYRPAEMPAGALDGLRNCRACVDVELGPLSRVAVDRLMADPDLVEAVCETTDRSPFAVAEVLRGLVDRGQVTPGPGGRWRSRTPGAAVRAAELGRAGQRRAVQARAGLQTGTAAEVLALVALLDREASAGTIAAAAGLAPRPALDVLSALATAGLLRLGERGWTTAHDLVGETVVGRLPAADRGRLHGLLARALEAEDADPSELARHHRGAGDTDAAARAFAGAAAQALEGHAPREAAALATAGLALDPRAPVRADLLAARADAVAVHGELAAAVADLRAALVDTVAGPVRSRRQSRLAMLTFGAQDPHGAAELAELAIVAAGSDDAARALALETAAVLDMNLAREDRARARSDTALGLYRQVGDARGAARILDARAMATFLDGRIVEGGDELGRAAQLFVDSGELLRVVTPRSTRGHALVFRARPEEGLDEASAALRLACDLDAPEQQTYALWHRSEALSAVGRVHEAEADAREALSIARAVDHRGWTATAHRALGIALVARGELDDAAAAFAESAAIAREDLTLFASWAAARSALVAVARGRPDSADAWVARALAIGPPLGHFEGRLAQVELAVARADPAAGTLARTALARARADGHEVSAERLLTTLEAAARG